MNPAILVVEDEFIVSAEIEERITAMGYRSVGSADRGGSDRSDRFLSF